ncbi:MAG: DUF4143 domain-containing protein [Pseudomonadota bacterium]
MVRTPKLYFLDAGLCANLTEWSSPETLESGARSRAILEAWIMAEILKGWWRNGRRAPFYQYRGQDQREIDLVIVGDGALYPVEFKKTALPDSSAMRPFQARERLKMPVGQGGVVCLATQILPSAVGSLRAGRLPFCGGAVAGDAA